MQHSLNVVLVLTPFKSSVASSTTSRARLVLPNDSVLRTRIMQECHDTPLGGHLGKDKTIEQVKRRVYWSGMDADIAKYVTSCDACQRNKPSQQAKMGQLMSLADSALPLATSQHGLDHRGFHVRVPGTMPSSYTSVS